MGDRFNEDLFGEIFTEGNVHSADVADQGAALGHFPDLGAFAEAHFPQSLADRRLIVQKCFDAHRDVDVRIKKITGGCLGMHVVVFFLHGSI